ncbi:hypothetical protein PS639_05728 [Pseudomonas fluorescens]|nr:hypothetical protein PS639_05728 [Pseudomonas fluorescens]
MNPTPAARRAREADAAPVGARMNRPVKITSPPQLALQSYLDSLLVETTEALPLEIEALPEAPVVNAPVDVAELAELIASGGARHMGGS